MPAPRTEVEAIDHQTEQLVAAIAAQTAAITAIGTALAAQTAGVAELVQEVKELAAQTKAAGEAQARACHLMGYQLTMASLLERAESLGLDNDAAIDQTLGRATGVMHAAQKILLDNPV